MSEQIHWTEEADVVVVGYGGAGAVTAIAAHDAGAEVLILEKELQDTPTSTNHTPSTRMSGGGILVPEDTEKAIEYFTNLRRIANESVDEEEAAMIRTSCPAPRLSASFGSRQTTETGAAQRCSAL